MFIPNFQGVLIGITATLTMDVLSVTAIKLRLIAPLPPHLIGRWFASVARGQALHADIGHVSPTRHEMAIAVPAHYAIGVMLALLYVLVCSAIGLNPRSPIAAFGFALCTNLFPWLLTLVPIRNSRNSHEKS